MKQNLVPTKVMSAVCFLWPHGCKKQPTVWSYEHEAFACLEHSNCLDNEQLSFLTIDDRPSN